MIKILAIDDDVDLLNIYKEALHPLGCQIDTAEDAVSAITQYHKVQPNLILLDVKMPAGGGLKVFDQLRASFGSPVPIIFITATARRELGTILKLHKVFYLQKPFTRKQLLAKIKESLFGKTNPPPPPPPPAAG